MAPQLQPGPGMRAAPVLRPAPLRQLVAPASRSFRPASLAVRCGAPGPLSPARDAGCGGQAPAAAASQPEPGWRRRRGCERRPPTQTCRAAMPHRLGSVAPDTGSGSSSAAAAWGWFYAFFKFSRPHTMLGTFISVLSVSLLALGPSDFGWTSLCGLLQAVVPALLMNIHIVGLNQIFDVEIDKVNKPYLPLASGEFSMQTAVAIVACCGAAALAMGLLTGSLPLLATLAGSAALGVAYSVDLPLLRWKKHPVVAAACILAVRAVLVQLGFFFHMRGVVGDGRLSLTRPLAFTIAFMLCFSVVIALFKDIPDVQGDAQAGVRTFSVRQGTRRVFWACIALLECAYAGAVLTGLASQVLWSRLATVAAHALMGGLLLARARATDLSRSASIYGCYMFVWKLFYAEYLLIPLLR